MENACPSTHLLRGYSRAARNCRCDQACSARGILPVTAALLITILMVPSVWAVAPSSSVSDASGYEIPLGELNKVKKERPQKKEIKERKKRKGESRVHQPTADVVVPSEKVDPVPAVTPVSASGVSPPVAPITIHHDPYSYVIAGKRTTIQAVISSADSIKTVYCRFHATEKGGYASVPMQQVTGTYFTYAATLPGLAATSQSLRYSVIAVDSSGHEVRSQEFVIAVKPSAVLPGWQLDSSPDVLKIRLENREKPLEEFSDPGIVVE